MSLPAPGSSSHSKRPSLLARWLRRLDAVPYSVLAIPLRFAVATVFWNSGMTKLANWDTAVALFVDEYKVPLIPPEIAAYMAVSIELTTPVLLVLGLLTRPAALVLLLMTTFIEVFVYPLAWPTHIQWAAILLVLLCRGPGRLSIDHWFWRQFEVSRSTDVSTPPGETDVKSEKIGDALDGSQLRLNGNSTTSRR